MARRPPNPQQAPSRAGQNELGSGDVPPTFRTRTNVVLVPVVVRDKEGHTVGSFTQDDFQLFDEGRPQKIIQFSVESAAAASSTGPVQEKRRRNGTSRTYSMTCTSNSAVW
ncbi:MAG: hypothetical protein U0Q18_35065 [Bryobacteraceae bacterium]